jgi:hypothetical protein
MRPHQAIDRGRVYVERPCDVSNRFAFCQQLRRNLGLVSIELARPAEAYATLFCGLPTCPGPFTN